MTTEFLNSIHFTVVSADEPDKPLCPAWLTEAEAQRIANDLIDATGADYLVVDAHTLEAG